MTSAPQAGAERTADVTVVGAGPVGLSIANFLGLRGISVNVVEALPALIDYPRGVGIDDESLRSLQTMGLIQDVLPHTTPSHIMRLTNGKGRILVEIAPSADEFGWSRRNAFVQPAVDRMLHAGLARFDTVDVHFNHSMVAIRETGDVVEVDTTNEAGEPMRFRSRYLVGADGGRSLTRKHTGTTFQGQSPSTRWLVIDLENDPLGTPNVWVGGDPRRPFVSLGLPHALRRFEFMLFENEPDERIEDADFVAGLLERHVPDPRSLQILRKRVYTHHSRIAGDFRTGSVFLAGDAAHLMPVWQGQGWNSGMRDATNLSWKLAEVITGKAHDALLDTYNSERRSHAKAMIDISVAFGRFVKPTNVFVAGLRDGAASMLNVVPAVKQYFAQMKYKPMPRYVSGVVVDPVDGSIGSARAQLGGALTPYRNFRRTPSPVGTQFIQPLVREVDGADRLLDDVIGYRWAVLQWGGDPTRHMTEDELELLRDLDAVAISLRPLSQVPNQEESGACVVLGDTTGRIKRWFDGRPTSCIVLRPDRFVAAGGLAQDTGRLLTAAAAAAHIRRKERS